MVFDVTRSGERTWREFGQPWSLPGASDFGWLAATAFEGGPVEVVALGPDGELRRARVPDSGPGEPEWVSLRVLGVGSGAGSGVGGFAAVATRPGELHVFCPMGPQARDLGYWHPRRGLNSLSTGPPAGPSDAVAVAPGRVEVFTAGSR
ncbi:hypothetical protein [Kitasatospora sp. NPDC093102]|uniref:hypothetical protein n=1 Tax=Kitasatospora sp. NPDC093102 TaxID=3155069 RepID=UPI003412FA63